MSWLKEVIGTEKAIIAMCHLDPLPGDPSYGPGSTMEQVIENARKDLLALQNGGVDAVMFSNEFSLPYLTQVDLAAATGAKFVREIFTGVYASDFGLWNTNIGKTIRHQHKVGAGDVKLLFNIVPEAAKYVADRDIESIAKSTVFNNRPDALCVSGLTAGAETDAQLLKRVKDVVPNTVVLANTGVRYENVEQQLTYADGAVVGTTFKKDGVFENHVDEARVKRFMDKVRAFREK